VDGIIASVASEHTARAAGAKAKAAREEHANVPISSSVIRKVGMTRTEKWCVIYGEDGLEGSGRPCETREIALSLAFTRMHTVRDNVYAVRSTLGVTISREQLEEMYAARPR
jgi:hypothetical protein